MRRLIIMMIGMLALGMASVPADTFPTDRVYKYRFSSYKSTYDSVGSFKFGEPFLHCEKLYQPFVNISKRDTLALLRKDGGKTFLLFEDRYFEPNFGSIRRDLSSHKDLFIAANTECMVHDFDASEGVSFSGLMTYDFMYGNTWVETVDVANSDTIYINGQMWKRQFLTQGSRNRIVENVGGEVGLFPFTFHMLSTGCDQSIYFIGLYDLDNNQIFGADDFNAQPIGVGVDCLTQDDEKHSDGKLYDLNGREIRNPLPGTVYICNGRKAVAR